MDPSLKVEVERVSPDPDTDRGTTLKIDGEELQSEDGVRRLQYTVSKNDSFQVNLLNRNSTPAKIRVVFVLESSEEPVDTLGDADGIVELQNGSFNQKFEWQRIYWRINVRPTRETIRIYDRYSTLLMELKFHNSD